MPNITGLTNSYASTSLAAHNEHVDRAGNNLQQLSTGNRFTSASVDASSAAIVHTMNSNLQVYRQAEINARNGSALIQVGVGVINSQINLLNQMKSLAAQAAGGDLDSNKRLLIDAQFQQLMQQIDSNAVRARWNGTSLLLGGGGAVTEAGAVTASGTNIADAGAIMAAGITGAHSTGFISGTATSVSVTANAANAANFDISLVLQDRNGGSQTFQGLNLTPTNATAFTLYSTTDSKNALTFTWGGSATGVALNALSAALTEAFGLGAGGNPASFVSGSTALNGGVASITAGSSTTAGTYALSYAANSNTLKLSQGAIEYSVGLSANGAQALTFANGITVDLDHTFDLGTGITQTVFTVGANTSSSLTFQLDLLSTDTQTVQFSAATTEALGIAGLSVTSQANAQVATTALTNALQQLNLSYAQLGSSQKRLEATIANLETTIQNNQAAASVYGDVDLAQALTEYVKENTMQQVSFTAISQALNMQKDLAGFVRNS